MRDYQIHCPQCAAPNYASEERCSACGARLRASRAAAGRAGLPPLVSPSGRLMPEFEDDRRAAARDAARPTEDTPAPSPLQAPPPTSLAMGPAVLEKYPNLRRHLKWMRFLAEHTLFLFLVLALLTAVSPFFIPLPGLAWLKFLGLPVGVLTLVVGWLLYIYQMAAVELVEVWMDTEENTRLMAGWLVQQGEVREKD